MNVRIIVFTCLSFGAATGCFGVNSILNTAERNTAANALVARDAQELKVLYIKASKIAKANAITAKVFTGVSAPLIFTRWSIAGVALVPLNVLYFVIAGRRARMYERFAKHVDLIFALLNSPEFKNRMGVTDWGRVRQVRREAENSAILAQFLGTLPSGLATASMLGLLRVQAQVGYLLGAVFGAFGLKPIIAKAIRKRGGAPDLEKEFIKIIEAYERTGVVPYGVTVQNNGSGGITASTTYAEPGMQSTVYPTVYPIESARDKYLRLLAERQATKEGQASE